MLSEDKDEQQRSSSERSSERSREVALTRSVVVHSCCSARPGAFIQLRSRSLAEGKRDHVVLRKCQ
ncbi:hypothetical protein JOB18_023961 [Solea senegalensis]|uniref:Uncharacterized protein n=1 Tax=Solea senegalensis TaxID=28829 RepID=A0AAV6PCS8_SOLSE|nr:hypothetical protein JOB18_023961 [Solea senegalensis]